VGLSSAAFRATEAAADRNSTLIAAGISARLSEHIRLGFANTNRIGGSAQIRVSF
jgi:hypothetical protein